MFCCLSVFPKRVVSACCFGIAAINCVFIALTPVIGSYEYDLGQELPDNYHDSSPNIPLENKIRIDRDVKSQDEKGSPVTSDQGPPLEYEKLRRRIYSNTNDLWFYLRNELTTLKTRAATDKEKQRIQDIIDQTAERKRSLLLDQQSLPKVDGHDSWRQREAVQVAELVQRRLRHIQNPADCRKARKILCHLPKSCGFGCIVHHISYCMVHAYATRRTLVVNFKNWDLNDRQWNALFQPLSETCTSTYEDEPAPWTENAVESKARVLLPLNDRAAPKPAFLPLAVPDDIGRRVARFNGDPAAWWLGQLMKYILRLRTDTQRAVARVIRNMKYQTPIVGVHIRRSDKIWGREAYFHHVAEYMEQVDDYYDTLDLTRDEPALRRVYLATDNAQVQVEARKTYPQYEFVAKKAIAQHAAVNARWSRKSVVALLADLHMLAGSDYLVCTFTSNIGRLAYELQHTNRPDAGHSAYSLDYSFNYRATSYTLVPLRRAVIAHHNHTTHEIALQIGDEIEIPASGNLLNGYGIGVNKRTNKTGLFPWFKTSSLITLYPFPTYEHV